MMSLRERSGSSAGARPAASRRGSVSSKIRPFDRARVSVVTAAEKGETAYFTRWSGHLLREAFGAAMREPAGDVGRANGAIVAQHHEHAQRVVDAFAKLHA